MKKPEANLLTVIVPVYNEARTVRLAVDRLLKARLPVCFDVVVVDDGSTDGSADMVRDLEERCAIRLVRHPQNRGKGAAVRTGISVARGNIITILDADLECDPEDYSALLEPILADRARVVYGARSFDASTGSSPWFALGNRGITLCTNLLNRASLSDIETCFKVATTDVWRSMDLREDGFGIEAEVTAKLLRAGETIHEVPISYRARSRAAGKHIHWKDGIAALWILLRIRLFGR